MRERLDEVNYQVFIPLYKKLFVQCQRSGKLELFKYFDNKYLMPIDGTGYFHSKKVHCDNCCEKNHRDGSKSYYHQMLSAAIVHPDINVVLPFAPEPIMKTDGAKKNDCECRAAERYLSNLKREHPYLKLIITDVGLFSTGAFIIVAKPKNHVALFDEFNNLPRSSYQIKKHSIIHKFEWINNIAINDTHQDCKVNVLEYWEEDKKGKIKHWVWVTDIPLCKENVYKIMRGGRARHKIENETFNTLKNQVDKLNLVLFNPNPLKHIIFTA